ncbi:MAG: hypothetical protein KAW87_05615 [Candidatus Cloacimonetes bacterium]|nr:hypothetical protein [Candidatus Cloacimonadota bacterium]
MENNKSFLKALLNSLTSFGRLFPIMLGVIFCIGLFHVYISKHLLKNVFSGKIIQDTLIGGFIGSITAGNPINSYIIGKQLLDGGVTLFAVTAFIICWVSVGVVQFPYESAVMGKKFAISRNLISFALSFFIAIGTVLILKVV